METLSDKAEAHAIGSMSEGVDACHGSPQLASRNGIAEVAVEASSGISRMRRNTARVLGQLAMLYTEKKNIPSKNNFDFLRFFFASIVVFVHCMALSASPKLAFIDEMANGTFAVDGFFVISGFLIFMSYEHSKSNAVYFSKRLRRILPAYISVIIFFAITLSLVSTLPLREYFGLSFVKYLAANLLFLNFLHPDLPGVFDHAPHVMAAVNGALWTLKIEVSFYLVVPIIFYLMRRFGHFRTIVAIFALSACYAQFFSHLFGMSHKPIWDLLAKQLPGQMTFFIMGGALYIYYNVAEKYLRQLVLIGIPLLIVGWFCSKSFLYPVGLSFVVFSAAFMKYFGNFGRYGDFSYGLYIWHFPVVQLLVGGGVFLLAPYLGVLIGFLVALTLSVASWHFLEKPWLLNSSHYRRTELAPAK